MPPTGTALGIASGSAALPTSHNWTTAYQPIFSSTTIDHSQAEIARTYLYREFGNGAANQGNNTSGTMQDFSMLNSTDDVSYVMEDGLTSQNGRALINGGFGGIDIAYEMKLYYYFIGTGFSYSRATSSTVTDTQNVCQNLPYGTHVISFERQTGASNNMPLYIDDVALTSGTTTYGVFHQLKEVSFHQPKMPPIPEDAVVIADYMLMADYVKNTSNGIRKISKGVRKCSGTRDVHHNSTAGGNFVTIGQSWEFEQGFNQIYIGSNQAAGVIKHHLPAFGTHGEILGYADRRDLHVDDVALSHPSTATQSGTGFASVVTQNTASPLGYHKWSSSNKATTNSAFSSFNIVTPIHTSSHYQEFETPYTKELIGGDRNMEQTNLVCSPEGKTWDEVTRDTSSVSYTHLTLPTKA